LASAAPSPPHPTGSIPAFASLPSLSPKYQVLLIPNSYMTKVNCPVTCLNVSDMSVYLMTLRVKVFHRYWWNWNVVLLVVVFMNRKIKIRHRRIAAHTKRTFQGRQRKVPVGASSFRRTIMFSTSVNTDSVFINIFLRVMAINN